MKELGIYIHIPFCKQKCYYCDFFSLPCSESKIPKYIDALKEEIINSIKIDNIDEYIVKTIYFGGGTPSFIDSKFILQILEELKSKYNIQENVETTIEVNPGTVDEKKLISYKKSGINRLSIGLQSDKDDILQNIGRIHKFEDFLNTYSIARKIGFENINVDLMLGLPNQTTKILEETVNNVIKLRPEHISIYSLILEEGTQLEKLVNDKKITLPSEDEEREMYYVSREILKQNEYEQYEISNYSKKGFESKHNLDCWNQKEYIGYGSGAHSYIEMERFSNITDIDEYILNIEKGNIEKNYITHEIQEKWAQMNEYMLLGLRKIEGVSISNFKQKFDENPIYTYRIILNKLVNMELIEVDDDFIKLTIKGIDFANIVWEEFI